MEVMRTIGGTVVVVCALAACGGGGGGEPVSADEAEDLCRPACERDEACNPAEPADICTPQCAAEFAGWAAADALEAYTDCYADLACGVQDTCLGTVQPQSIHEEYEARCREVVTCLNAESIDAFCEVTADDAEGVDDGLVRFFAAEVVEEMIACFDSADCYGAIQCVYAIYERYGVSGE